MHMYTHSSLILGSITYLPNDRQPNNCTWDSLFSDFPPLRPHGIEEGTKFKLGESTISGSGDVCSEGSWVFYSTHNVCSIVGFLGLHSLRYHLRLNHLQTLRGSIKSLQARGTEQDHSSFLSRGTSLHREMTTTGCPYSGAIPRTPALLCHQRSVLLTVR